MMKSLGQQLNGQVQLAYQPSGFIYSLDVPAWLRRGSRLTIVLFRSSHQTDMPSHERSLPFYDPDLRAKDPLS
jgi:hypothetical protein